MSSVPGVDHPEEQSEADITLAARGISVNARVESVDDGVLVLRPSAGEYVGHSVVEPGDRVEVYWKATETRRVLPAGVLEVESGAVVRWRLQIIGAAQESQRRTAVRGRVALPVSVGHGPLELGGESLDLSENGVRAQFDGFGALPEPGVHVDLTVGLEDGELSTKAEIVRAQSRGARWLMSIRFVGIPEKEQDRVRRRVFQALREERARNVD